MKRNDKDPVSLPDCRHCQEFNLCRINAHRIMAVCQAKHVVLQPQFPKEGPDKRVFLSKTTISDAVFKPVDNCPDLEALRAKKLIPWPSFTIDYSEK